MKALDLLQARWTTIIPQKPSIICLGFLSERIHKDVHIGNETNRLCTAEFISFMLNVNSYTPEISTIRPSLIEEANKIASQADYTHIATASRENGHAPDTLERLLLIAPTKVSTARQPPFLPTHTKFRALTQP